MRHFKRLRAAYEQGMFQSSPDAMAGCDAIHTDCVIHDARFQSSPDAMAGCDDWTADPWAGWSAVSILTRRDDRVRR